MKSRVLFCILLAFCLLYVAQAWTPLRLNTDSIVLLSIASSAADGYGFLDHGVKTHFPPGYPFMVVCLDKVGAGHSWGLVGLNVLFLFIALAAGFYIARVHFQLTSEWALLALLFATSSFVLIKHFTLALTDVPFCGISLLALALATRAGQSQAKSSFFAYWTLAVLVATVGVLVRSVAIAIYPSLLWLLGEHFDAARFLQRTRRIFIVAGAAAVGAGFPTAVLLLRTKYVQEALVGYSQMGVGHMLGQILLYRMHEFGELALNAPASKLGKLSIVVGIVGAAVMVALLASLRHLRLTFIEVYLAAYAFILFLWPYPDTRFWTPVLPLVFAAIFAAWRPWNFTGWKRMAGFSYGAAYLLLGCLAMAYSTRITFSGRDFPNRFGDGRLRSTYELFYSEPTDHSPISRPALELLERYSRPAPR